MLKSIQLQNFRSYPKAKFEFSDLSTLIVGPNTAGKSNLLEAIYLISTGKSNRAEKDPQMIHFGKELARVKAETSDLELEVLLTNGNLGGVKSQFKKFLVNGVAKRRVDFAGNLPAVLFSPQDLDIIIDSPALRREFLNNFLEQIDRDYRIANIAYTKALRQRNALLEIARETGSKNLRQFEYWDNQVIQNGQIITRARENFVEYVNNAKKDIFEFTMQYDKSEISEERLKQYEKEELAATVTLVGPHRDDFSLLMKNHDLHDVRYFGSRGQQRLAILQLKSLELEYIEKILEKKPLLILDDIFSELDSNHIKLILDKIGRQQTIISTTHKEFVDSKYLKQMSLITL